jgi:2-dehydro-3-deoxygluconokinase
MTDGRPGGSMADGGLVTAGETMGLLVQADPGHVRNGEAMTFGMGGSESNVAIGVRRLGVPAMWVGRLGADPAGELIRRELRAEQVVAAAVDDPAPTGLMIRWRPVAGRGRVVYYRRGSAGSHLRPGDIPEDAVRRAGVFHSTGITLALGAGPADAVAQATAVARAAGTTVSFDVNYRGALWSESDAAAAVAAVLPDCDVVFAGAKEAEMVAGTSDPLRAARALRAMGPSQVLIKLGSDGCLGLIDDETFEVPAPAVAVVDTVGAGDAFVAGYLAELIAGADPARRLTTAVAAGAFAVTVPGDWEGLPHRESLELLASSEPVIR